MQRDLRLLVVRHLHAEGVGHGRDTAPLGDARRDGHVDVQVIHGAARHQVAAAVPRDLALAGRDRDAQAAHARVAVDLVVPAHGLLEPRQVQIADAAGELHRLRHRPGLVRIGAQVKLGPPILRARRARSMSSSTDSLPTLSFMPKMPWSL